MKMKRVWAMPSSHTFTIKPIRSLVKWYLSKSQVSIDPFARNNRWATYTNDLNPETQAEYHLDALTFLRQLKTAGVKADFVILDPPYSITQAKECYDDFGADKLDISVTSMEYWAELKNTASKILDANGIGINCGWNSNGFGLDRGFELVELLLVAHGGSKNDTIVTVERKLPESNKLF
jgi:hypothetical protein